MNIDDPPTYGPQDPFSHFGIKWPYLWNALFDSP